MSLNYCVQILGSIEWGAVSEIIAASCALIATTIPLWCYMRKQVISLLLKWWQQLQRLSTALSILILNYYPKI